MVVYVASEGSALTTPLADAMREAGHSYVFPTTFHRGDLNVLQRCDALLLPPEWSNGQHPLADAAQSYALAHGIPIYVLPDIPPPHPTEVRCPQQVDAFIALVMRMYRVHLAKNADYSPANILVPGEIGLVTRLWDKVARLLSLSGFRFEVIAPGRYEHPRAPQNEAIEDTYLDLAVYGVIGLLLRRGVWGK